MGTIHWIHSDIENPVATEKAESAPDLDTMQEFVGGIIEVVHVLFLDQRTQMIVNEEGLLKHLPFNIRATSLYHLASIHQRGEFPHQPIVGNAIVLHDLPLE